MAEKIRMIGSLVKLYLQKAINVLYIMMLHFEEIVTYSAEQVEELSKDLQNVVETKELIDDMIAQLKEEIFKKEE